MSIAAAKGIYDGLVFANLEDGLPFIRDGHFDATISVGVLSYVENFSALFDSAARVTSPGGFVVVTHRTDLWDNNTNGVRTESTRIEECGVWELAEVGEPEAYMPQNPDPTESQKSIRIIAWKKKK